MMASLSITLLVACAGWSGPRMSAEYVGTSDVRHFLIGETESVFPLAFSASVLQADDNGIKVGSTADHRCADAGLLPAQQRPHLRS